MYFAMKRKLTVAEINDMCSVVTYNRSIPEETANCVHDGVVKSIRGQLEAIEIYPDMIPKLKKVIEREYHTTLLQPGEMVGVQAATSIGEPVSQMTLNAFHFSGISSIGIASGVPRVEELLNASKKQKSYGMTLFMEQKWDIHALRRKIMSSIMEVYLSNVTDHYIVEYISSVNDLSEMDKKWYPLYFAMYSNELLEDGDLRFHWRIRFQLSRTKLYEHSISCLTIAKKIEDTFRDLYVVASPDNLGIVDVYIDFTQMKLKKKEEEDISVMESKKESICLHNIILPYLNDILISGVEGVESMFIREDKGEWVIDTQGSNLMNIFAYEGFDAKRCQSSDIWEIYNMLGVEATRQFIINEFYKVLAISGASVGRRHIELLADSMTFQGKINSVNRYGIDRNETGPLAKASFEESVNNFFIASVNNETDDMGVSSSIMAGKMTEMGTGYMDMLLDIDAKMPNVHVPDPIADREEKKKKEEKKNEEKKWEVEKTMHAMQNLSISPNLFPMTYQLPYMPTQVIEHPKPEAYAIPETHGPKRSSKPKTKPKEEEPKTISWVKKTKKVAVMFSEDP